MDIAVRFERGESMYTYANVLEINGYYIEVYSYRRPQ